MIAKSDGLRWTEYVVRMEKRRNAFRTVVEEPEKQPFWELELVLDDGQERVGLCVLLPERWLCSKSNSLVRAVMVTVPSMLTGVRRGHFTCREFATRALAVQLEATASQLCNFLPCSELLSGQSPCRVLTTKRVWRLGRIVPCTWISWSHWMGGWKCR
jgi:hypothetical protein